MVCGLHAQGDPSRRKFSLRFSPIPPRYTPPPFLRQQTGLGADQTSLDILNLDRISSNHSVQFQLVPSQVRIDGNKKTNFLASCLAEEGMNLIGSLTFSELFFLKKIELNHLERTPPTQPWYLGRNPGCSFRLMPQKYQSTFSRFVSNHIKALTYGRGQNIFPEAAGVFPSWSLLRTF
ncbi:hypothetical protein TNCV_2872251 [Trichonephila clavipes]|nr:hypothetical protein TNCV_2872251 [Trichonephila clavipes]